jgi:hypothetical protein
VVVGSLVSVHAWRAVDGKWLVVRFVTEVVPKNEHLNEILEVTGEKKCRGKKNSPTDEQ